MKLQPPKYLVYRYGLRSSRLTHPLVPRTTQGRCPAWVLAACWCFQKGLFQSREALVLGKASLSMALVQRACNTALLVKSACCFLVENQLDAALPKIACAVVVGMLLIHHQQSNSTIEQITKAIISPTQILTAMGSCALLDRKMFVMGFILSKDFFFSFKLLLLQVV